MTWLNTNWLTNLKENDLNMQEKKFALIMFGSWNVEEKTAHATIIYMYFHNLYNFYWQRNNLNKIVSSLNLYKMWMKGFLSIKNLEAYIFCNHSLKLEISFDIQGSHCHATKEKVGVDKRARRKLIIASTLCVLFMIGEIIGNMYFKKIQEKYWKIEKVNCHSWY